MWANTLENQVFLFQFSHKECAVQAQSSRNIQHKRGPVKICCSLLTKHLTVKLYLHSRFRADNETLCGTIDFAFQK
jgi:hypothetical protein